MKEASFKVIFNNTNVVHSGQQGWQQNGQVSKYQKLVLEYYTIPKLMVEIKDYLKINSKKYVRDKNIKTLIDNDLLCYTNKKTLTQVTKCMWH